MCFYGAICFIHFNLICNMTTFRKKSFTFDLTPGAESVCKDSVTMSNVRNIRISDGCVYAQIR